MSVSNKRKLEKAVKFRDRSLESIPGSLKSDITAQSRDIATNVSESSFKVISKFGVIHQVMPLNDVIMVSVLKSHTDVAHDHSSGDSLGHAGDDSLFNSFFLDPDDTPLLASMIPLVNFNQQLLQVNLEDLIGKKVKVKVIDGYYATEAQLVSFTDYDFSHESKITLMNFATAQNLDLNVFQYLTSLGYEEDVLEDFYKLKLQDYMQEGVIRFENEAYWDKDMANFKDSDIFIALDKSPKSLIGRNYLKMKTQFCHMPVIMFSGK